MKIVVCGGRYYDNREAVHRTLNYMDGQFDITRVATGGANGADALAANWAAIANVPYVKYVVTKEDWDRLGKAAGPRRNGIMLREEQPDAVVAFPGGRGTADMVRRARENGLRVIEVN